jgi:hypothetical protein
MKSCFLFNFRLRLVRSGICWGHLCCRLGQIITSAVSFGHVIAYFGLDILFLGAVDQGGVIWINSQRVGVLNIWAG